MASWPMKPRTSSASRSSEISGKASARAAAIARSPSGSTRCITLMMWVAITSPGM
ncbi:Uncharacterised protein [Mycobacteroides abscessus subsp. abscessus]|nr:Uncharacterised protein [Mycobacteroides abscessus subsp. abscessus]